MLTFNKRFTDKSVCEADGLGGNCHPEAPPICWDDGWLTDEAVHWVDKLSRVALVIPAGHVGDVICADRSSVPLQQDKQETWKLPPSRYGYVWCFPACFFYHLIASWRQECMWNFFYFFSHLIVAGIINKICRKHRHGTRRVKRWRKGKLYERKIILKITSTLFYNFSYRHLNFSIALKQESQSWSKSKKQDKI